MVKKKVNKSAGMLIFALLAAFLIVFLFSNRLGYTGAAVLRNEYITTQLNIQNANKVAYDVVNEIILPLNCKVSCDNVINRDVLPGNIAVDIVADSPEAIEKFRESCGYYYKSFCR